MNKISNKKIFIKGYSDFSLSQSGPDSRLIPGSRWGAHFKLDTNVSLLFPYVNAVIEGAIFHEKPDYIQFQLDEFHCTLYPDDVIAAAFSNKKQALEFVWRLIDFLNDLFIKKNRIRPNHKKYKHVAAFDIFKLLPQTNCRACGYQTCMAFAGALSKGRIAPDKCPDFSSPMTESAVYPVYDAEGNLISTVEIDLDVKKMKQEHKRQEAYIESLEKKISKITQEKPLLKEDNNESETEVETDLTGREIEVLRLVAEGATNTEISDQLSISPHTVKSHVIHIFNKLGVNDRTQAAVWATRNKII